VTTTPWMVIMTMRLLYVMRQGGSPPSRG
jgi:hypothetical protein